jgi:hypothetical protein
MSISKHKWFEVWFDEGSDLLPSYLLIVVPDADNDGQVVVHDPFENNRIVHQGQSYEETTAWLAEDEYSLVVGRVFPDDGFPLELAEKPS